MHRAPELPGADQAIDIVARLLPINLAVSRHTGTGIRGDGFVLGSWGQCAVARRVQESIKQPHGHFCDFVLNRIVRFARVRRDGLLKINIAGVDGVRELEQCCAQLVMAEN